MQLDGIEGAIALTGVVFETDDARLTPGLKATHPVVPVATRLSACGRSVPVVAVLVSTYGVAAAVPTRMY